MLVVDIVLAVVLLGLLVIALVSNDFLRIFVCSIGITLVSGVFCFSKGSFMSGSVFMVSFLALDAVAYLFLRSLPAPAMDGADDSSSAIMKKAVYFWVWIQLGLGSFLILSFRVVQQEQELIDFEAFILKKGWLFLLTLMSSGALLVFSGMSLVNRDRAEREGDS